jgi:small subunit ribosomal protein S2
MTSESVNEERKPLATQDEYLGAGAHIGTKFITGEMGPFIYKARTDKLFVFNLSVTDVRLELAAKLLSKYDPKDILVTASRMYAQKPAQAFADVIGTDILLSRFSPGTLTNSNSESFREPQVVLISDPKAERQAIDEAMQLGIPVVALCDTDSSARGVDLIVPCNNKGRKALALIYFLLAREITLLQGKISKRGEFNKTIVDFEERLTD